MKNLKLFILFILLQLASKEVSSQYDAMFTQYMFNEMFINPAYAGSKEALAVTALHREQWVDFSGRPMTTTLSLHGPLLQNKMGIGLSILNEKIGVLSRNLIYISYAYRIKAGEKGHFSLGLMAGIHTQTNKFTELQTTDPNDEQFSVNTRNTLTPNFGSGLYYYTNKFYVGISIPRMIDDNIIISSTGSISGRKKVNINKFHYYWVIGKVFNVNENLKLKPQLLVKAVATAPIQFDANLSALIKERLWLGMSYRSKSDMSVIAGVQINPQFLVTYSYDYSLTSIQKYSSGSHEIALGYILKFKENKIVSNRFF